jgi:hypothetical protein
MHSCELRGHAIRPWKVLFAALNAGYVSRFQTHLLHLQARCSQPSGEVRCDWRWHFRKHALSTSQFKLNAFMKLNLDSQFFSYVFVRFFSCIIMILTSYSNFQGIINPWHFKIGPVFIWNFLSQNLEYYLPHLCPNHMNRPIFLHKF